MCGEQSPKPPGSLPCQARPLAANAALLGATVSSAAAQNVWVDLRMRDEPANALRTHDDLVGGLALARDQMEFAHEDGRGC